jgi:hypothetical protein
VASRSDMAFANGFLADDAKRKDSDASFPEIVTLSVEKW